MSSVEATIKAQSDYIKQLQKENESMRKIIKKLKKDLFDLEAVNIVSKKGETWDALLHNKE